MQEKNINPNEKKQGEYPETGKQGGQGDLCKQGHGQDDLGKQGPGDSVKTGDTGKQGRE